jgi:putative oxidoreductase
MTVPPDLEELPMSVTVPRTIHSAEAGQSYGAHGSTAAETAKMLTRVMLGWFLLHQGWGKVVQEWTGGSGTFYQGDQFQNSNPDWLPTFVAAPYGYALPWLELVFGALLVLGIWNRISAGVSTLIFLSILIAWLDAGNLLPRHMLMIYTPLAAWYYCTGPGRFSLDTVRARRKAERRALGR